MPLTKTNLDNPIRGRLVVAGQRRDDCHDVIAKLVFADLGRNAGTLHMEGAARVDMQGRNAAGDANIQVQIGANTVAAAMVANTAQAAGDLYNQRGVSNAVISALNQSMDTGTVWSVTGALP